MDNKHVILSYEDHEELLKKAAEADKKEHTYSLVIREDSCFFYKIKAFHSTDAVIAGAVTECNERIESLRKIHNDLLECSNKEINRNILYKKLFYILFFVSVAEFIYFMFIK